MFELTLVKNVDTFKLSNLDVVYWTFLCLFLDLSSLQISDFLLPIGVHVSAGIVYQSIVPGSIFVPE